MPTVSVVMPNHNGGKYLRASIESVLNQTYSDLELIIVDDASTDDSIEIINSYQDERITKVFCDKNRHVAYTANQGLQLANGKYIARMDSDDIWMPEKLEKQVAYLEMHSGIGACFSRVHIIDDESEIADEKYSWLYQMFNDAANKTAEEWARYFFFKGNCLCNPSGLVRAQALDGVGRLHNIAYVPGQDFETWSRLVQKYPIHIMEEKLVYYRWTEKESKISSMKERGVSAFENVHMMMRSNYLDRMEKDDFIRIFKNCFVNEDSSSDIELECEKAFILLRCPKESTGDINFFGIRKMETILNTADGLKTLEEKFGFELKKYYSEYRTRNFYSYNVDIEIQKLENDIIQKTDELNKKNAEKELIEKHCHDLEAGLSDLEIGLSEEKGKCEKLNNALASKEKVLEEREKQLTESNQLVDELRQKNSGQQELMEESQKHIELLESRLNAIENSFTWKAFKPFRTIAKRISER